MLMTKEYILDCLNKYCTFNGALSSDSFYELVVCPLEAEKCFTNWTWDNGVTKGVLIFKDLSFVIKIPFNGGSGYGYSCYETAEGGRYCWEDAHTTNGSTREGFRYIEGEERFEDFCNADDGDENWDYCAAEARRYQAAECEGLDFAFAKTEWIGDVQNHPIYAQARCNMYEMEHNSTNKEKYEQRTKKDYEQLKAIRKEVDFYSIADDWVLDFFIFFGKETLKKLADFCWDHNITDLHNGNIGYREGVPCLVDYSSFDE